MSLNELGCGALAGTSWDVDRELVAEYLGCEGLIENTNDAVGYTDGYVVVTAGAANVLTVLSRMALELEHWSTMEYDFLDFEIGAGSFMMPNKRSNQGILEETAESASVGLGALVEVVSMGTKLPHGDMNPVAYAMKDGTLRALGRIDRSVEPYLYKFPSMIVKRDVMLAAAREGYSCSTELANEMCRSFGLDYRTAHEVVSHFVVESAKQGIPSREASLDVFQQAARAVLSRELDVTEERLRELLDPVYFVRVTDCRGGVAPKEVARMIADRRGKLAEARARHLARIEKLEKARQRLLADLRELSADGEATPK
jgi:argininosuccinate lyase